MRCCTIVAILVLGAHTAIAKPEHERLFDEARALKDTDWKKSCELFERSYNLDPKPGGGITGNVADCKYKQGDLPGAWRLWVQAGKRWKRENNPNGVRLARDQAATVAAHATTVVIVVPDPEASGLTIELNGKPLDVEAEVELVIEPGPVEMTARLPKHKPFTYSRTGGVGDRLKIRLAFEPLSKTSIDQLPPRVSESPRSRVRLALAIGAGGGLTLATGIALGVIGKGRYDDAVDAHCESPGPPPRNCTDLGKSKIDDAKRLGNIGTGVGIVGGALAIAGAVIYFTAPKSRVVPVVSTNGVAIGGRF